MANRYWVGGIGNWSDTAHWSTVSGGTSGASIPTSVDDVYIDQAGTYTITLDVTANCLSLDFTGSTSVTISRGTNPLNIYGNLINTASTSQSGSSAINMKSTSTASIDTKGRTLGSGSIQIDGVGGTFNIVSTLNSSNCDIYVKNGTFNTNNYDITCYLFNSNNTNTRVVNLGSSIINLTTYIDVSTTTGLTFNAGTSTIKTNSSSAYTNNLGGLTYYSFEVNSTNTTMTGNNTFNTLKVYPGKTLKLTSGTTQTVSNFNAIGTSGNIITMISTVAGNPATISKASGTVTVDYCSIQDITVTGGAIFNATNSTNVSGNSGWNFNGATNTAPTVPSNLSSSNKTSTSFRLTWTASTDTESNPITYKVYKGGILYQSGIANTYLDISSQTIGSTATWTVSATDGSLESTQSTGLDVTLNANTAPTIPSGLNATSITTSGFRLNWSASTDIDSGQTIVYKVFKDGVRYPDTSTTFSGLYADITGQSSGSTATWTVSASDGSTDSSQSTGLNVTINSVVNNPPSIPNGLAATNITTSGFRLSWNTSTDTEGNTPITYKVFKGGSLYQSGISNTYLDITGQTSGSSANWSVSSVDSGSRESNQSGILNVTINSVVNNSPTFKAGESPTIKTNSLTNTSVTIQFDMSDSESDAITVKVATKTTDSFVNGDYVTITPTWNSSADKWEVTINNLNPNTQYYSRIRIEDATHTGSSGTTSSSISYLTTNITLAPHGTLLYLYKDAFNYIRLFYSSYDNRFIVEKNVNGNIRTIGSPVVNITAGQPIFYSIKQTPNGLVVHTGVSGVLTKWGDNI